MRNKIFIVICLLPFFANAQLIKNDFMAGIAIGEAIEKGVYMTTSDDPMLGQWNRASRANNTSGSSPIAVAPLTYPGYTESGASNAFSLAKISESGKARLTGFSMISDNFFKGGTFYLAFMLNVSNTTVANPHAAVIMFDGSYAVDYQRICVCVGKSPTTTGKMRIGIVDKDLNDASGTAAYSPADYNFGETCLVVLKYNFLDGKAELFVNPQLTKTEPASLATITNTDLPSIKGISVRQRTNHSCIIGGLRFTASWTSAVGLDENDSREYANSYRAVDSRLHYSGRVDYKDTTVIMNWSGSYVTAKFSGTNMAAVLSGANGKVAVYIDGVKQSKYLATGSLPLVYSLVDNLAKGEHELVLHKVQKSSIPVTLHALKTDGILQLAVVNKAVKIEYFGNSITDGLSCAPNNASRDNQAYNDASLAYPCRLAEMLGAEYYCNAISGIALCTGAGYVTSGMEDRFNKLCPFSDSRTWNFSHFTPTICVMALGVNDNSNPGDIAWSTWRERYKAVVQRLLLFLN